VADSPAWDHVETCGHVREEADLAGAEGAPEGQSGWVPRPDPTLLTTEQLHREIDSLRELLETQIEALGDASEAKFGYIEQRFKDRDLLVDAAFISSKEAVAAALASSKEAVAKSEDTFNKQIAEGRRTAEATRLGLEGQIGGVEKRVTIIESLDRGSEKATAGYGQVANLGIAIFSVLAAIGALVVAVIVATGN
jgi:hypothetical protein